MVVETQCARFESIALDSGATLSPVEVAYETYGELNAARSNAILITHAFTGDAHAAGISHEGGKPGWWDNMIGPGKAFDTDRYFVICSNVLGGCQGTTGPGAMNPATGKPWAMAFPVITIRDMVRLQRMLIGHLGILEAVSRWRAGIDGRHAGARMGGEFSGNGLLHDLFRDHVWRHRAQQIARSTKWGRQVTVADPDWAEGDYYDKKRPARGLSVARMVGHITYMSDESMREKFGRRLREKEKFGFDFGVDLRSGELSSLSRESVRLALRREFVSLAIRN